MLGKESKEIIKFINKCRENSTIDDELSIAETNMCKIMETLEINLQGINIDKELLDDLSRAIFKTLDLTQAMYFEYGQNYYESINY